MATKPRPSGLPGDRAIRQVYGPPEFDVDQRFGDSHEGFRRVRRTLLVVSGLVAVLALVVAVVGSSAAAWGIVGLMLVPVLLALAGAQVAVFVTRPRRSGAKR